MDTIYINELEVPTHIGITEEERQNEQVLKVSAELYTNTRKVGTSDAIEDTIDYEHITMVIKELGMKNTCKTVEKFAEDVAEIILQTYKPERVKVCVWKFILPDTKGVCVTIERP